MPASDDQLGIALTDSEIEDVNRRLAHARELIAEISDILLPDVRPGRRWNVVHHQQRVCTHGWPSSCAPRCEVSRRG